jgi:phage FluMu protein Com
MERRLLRAYCDQRNARAGKPGEAIKFIASSPGVKRDGKDLNIGQWNLENYRRNPVFLWAHDYLGRTLPIGKSVVTVQGKQLLAEVTFDQADSFAQMVEGKYRRGFLNAVSVGWLDEVRCKHCSKKLDAWQSWGLEILRKKCPHCEKELRENDIDVRYDLLDISGVPVPGDPDALIMERMLKQRAATGQKPESFAGSFANVVSKTVSERLNLEILRCELELVTLIEMLERQR